MSDKNIPAGPNPDIQSYQEPTLNDVLGDVKNTSQILLATYTNQAYNDSDSDDISDSLSELAQTITLDPDKESDIAKFESLFSTLTSPTWDLIDECNHKLYHPSDPDDLYFPEAYDDTILSGILHRLICTKAESLLNLQVAPQVISQLKLVKTALEREGSKKLDTGQVCMYIDTANFIYALTSARLKVFADFNLEG